MVLDEEQQQFFVRLFEAAREVPRPHRKWYLACTSGGDFLHGPGKLGLVLATDLYAFEDEGLIRVVDRPAKGELEFVLSGSAAEFYAAVKARSGEALARTESEMRSLLDAAAFRESYPRGYARWSEAEGLLWTADSDRDFTTVGHKSREALQEFATEVVQRFNPPQVDPDPSKVNRRLGAAIAERRAVLGESRAGLLEALGDYSEAALKVVQRQEHGGQKEQEPLTWLDARRCVFHVAAVMFEFSVTLDHY